MSATITKNPTDKAALPPPAASAANAKHPSGKGSEASSSGSGLRHSGAAAVAAQRIEPSAQQAQSNDASRRLIQQQFHFSVSVDPSLVLPPDFFWRKYCAFVANPSLQTYQHRKVTRHCFGETPASGSPFPGILHTKIHPLRENSKLMTHVIAIPPSSGKAPGAAAAAPSSVSSTARPLLVAAACGRYVEVRNPQTGACVFQSSHFTSVLHLAASHDGLLLATVLSEGMEKTIDNKLTWVESRIKIENVVSRQALCTIRGTDIGNNISFEKCVFMPPHSALGNSLLITCMDHAAYTTTLCAYNIETRTLKILVKMDNFKLSKSSLSPSGNQLFMIGLSRGDDADQSLETVAHRWDFNQSNSAPIPCPIPNALGFSYLLAVSDTHVVVSFQPELDPEANQATAKDIPFTLRLIDTTMPDSVTLLEPTPKPTAQRLLEITGLALAPNNTLYITTSDSKIFMYDLSKKERLRTARRYPLVTVYKNEKGTEGVNRILDVATTPHAVVISVAQTGDVHVYNFDSIAVAEKDLLPTTAVVPSRPAAPAAANASQPKAPALQPPAVTAAAVLETEAPLPPKSSLDLHLTLSGETATSPTADLRMSGFGSQFPADNPEDTTWTSFARSEPGLHLPPFPSTTDFVLAAHTANAKENAPKTGSGARPKVGARVAPAVWPRANPSAHSPGQAGGAASASFYPKLVLSPPPPLHSAAVAAGAAAIASGLGSRHKASVKAHAYPPLVLSDASAAPSASAASAAAQVAYYYREICNYSFGEAPPAPAGSTASGLLHKFVHPHTIYSRSISHCVAFHEASSATAAVFIGAACGPHVEVRNSSNTCVYRATHDTIVNQLVASNDGLLATVLAKGDISDKDHKIVHFDHRIDILDVTTQETLHTISAKKLDPVAAKLNKEIVFGPCVFIPAASDSEYKGSLLLSWTIPSDQRTFLGALSFTQKEIEVRLFAKINHFALDTVSLSPSGTQLFATGLSQGDNPHTKGKMVIYKWDLKNKAGREVPFVIDSIDSKRVRLLAISDTELVVAYQPRKPGNDFEILSKPPPFELVRFDVATKTSTKLGHLEHVTSLNLGPSHTLHVATSDNKIYMYNLTLLRWERKHLKAPDVELYRTAKETQRVHSDLLVATTLQAVVVLTAQTGTAYAYQIGLKLVENETLPAAAAAAGAGSAAASSSRATAAAVAATNRATPVDPQPRPPGKFNIAAAAARDGADAEDAAELEAFYSFVPKKMPSLDTPTPPAALFTWAPRRQPDHFTFASGSGSATAGASKAAAAVTNKGAAPVAQPIAVADQKPMQGARAAKAAAVDFQHAGEKRKRKDDDTDNGKTREVIVIDSGSSNDFSA